MIDRNYKLSVSRQAQILGISRGSVYYLPQPASAADLALMRRIDELHLDYPFAGSRMLQGLLNADCHDVGRLHVRTLMRKMGIEAIYRRPADRRLAEAPSRPARVPRRWRGCRARSIAWQVPW
jgi:putative transposase